MENESFIRKMSAKHLIMLSLGGVIGTGIFLSSSYLIHTVGAVGTIIAYLIGAGLVTLVMMCLGELSVHEPSTSSFHNYASNYIHPGVGFVVAWLYWLTWTVALGSQFITMAILLQRWFPQLPVWLGCSLFILLIFLSNVMDVRWFAVSEFWMSLVKVIALGIFVLVGFFAIFGFVPIQYQQTTPFFHQLVQHGWFPKGAGAVFLAILSANFAFSGTELIGVAAGETTDPQKNIPKAIWQTIGILIVLFIGSIVVIGALLPDDAANLSESPMTVIFSRMGIPYAADIMNFVLITAVLSGANSGVYAASRMLWSLAAAGTLPKRFAKLSRHGLPIYGLAFTLMGGLLSLFSSVFAADTVYLALVSISALAVVLVWLSIGWAQLNFRKEFLRQGHTIENLAYKVPYYPVVPWLVILICLLSIMGIAFDPNQRIALIVGIPFVVVCFGYYQVMYRKK